LSKKIKHSFFYLIPSFLGGLLTLVSLPLLTRVLSPEDYGFLALSQVYAIFLTGLANFGLTFSFERDFFEERDKSKQAVLLYTIITFVSIILIIFGSLTFLFLDNILVFMNVKSRDVTDLFLLSFCSVSVTSIKNYFLIFYKNTENAKLFVWFTLDELIINFVLSLLLVLYFKVGIEGIVIAQLFGGSLLLIILLYKFFRMKSFEISYFFLKRSLTLSLPLTPRIFFGIIGAQFDKYIIGIAGTVGNVGVYNIAQKIANMGYVFMSAIQNAWGPPVYKMMFDGNEINKKLIGQFLRPFYYCSIFVCLLIGVFSEEIIYILAPTDYGEGAIIISILSIMYGAQFFGKQNQLIFSKKTVLISVLTLSGIFFNIGLNYVVVFEWGFIGVAWATLISSLLIGIIAYYFSQKSYTIIWPDYTLFIFLYFIFSVLVVVILIRSDLYYETKVVLKIILTLLYIFFGFALKIISKQNLVTVYNIVFKKS